AFRGRQDPVYEGGPVQKNVLMALYHGQPSPDSVEVGGDIYLTGDLGALNRVVPIRSGDSPVRFYLGYAGWSPRQLEGELEAGGWTLLPGNSNLVFGEEARSAWPEMMRRLGNEFEMYSHMPEDPSSN
ncbi:MAG TPA: YqgE/AlgH family protein, partial [Nitrospiria bacterium]